MNSEFSPTPREELEAHITALLLGELPENEAAALREKIAADPELRKLHTQIGLTIGLLKEAISSPEPAEIAAPQGLKMSDEKREKLLASFKVVKAPKPEKEPIRIDFKSWAALAAMIAVLVALSQSALFTTTRSRSTSQIASTIIRGEPVEEGRLQQLTDKPGGLAKGKSEPSAEWFYNEADVKAQNGLAKIELPQLAAAEENKNAVVAGEGKGVMAVQPTAGEVALSFGGAGGGKSMDLEATGNRAYYDSLGTSANAAGVGGVAGRLGEPTAPVTSPPSSLGFGVSVANGPAAGQQVAKSDAASSQPGQSVNLYAFDTPSAGKPIQILQGNTGDDFILSEPDVTRGVSRGRDGVERQIVLGADFGEAKKVPAKVAETKLGVLADRVDSSIENSGDKEKKVEAELPGAQLEKLSLEREETLSRAKVEIQKAQESESSQVTPVSNPSIPQPEVATAANPFSTFSLNVSDVSFKLAAASLEKGVMPEAASIRSEEFINAIDYRDPAAVSAPVAFAWERARYPFAHDRDLLRFSVKTAAIGREAGKPLNLVLLLDASGSMERADRVRIIQECLRVLATQLQAQDRVSVVTFARTPRLWVDGLPGSAAGELVSRVGTVTPEGGTNLEEAMRVGYETAARHFAANGVNRVVLLTDGAANLGDVKAESLKKRVEENRKKGIALDCFGIGWEGLNDDLLEQLSRNGDGRYGFVNTPEAETTEFAQQLAGALKVAASDVKVQVEFNPKRATAYRQIGYAKHQLTKEQFRDNTVDAAEIGAAEAGNALYVVQVNPAGEGPIATVRARFKIPGTNDYREHEWPVNYEGASAPLEKSTATMRVAGAASAFSEWLSASPYAGEVTPERLLGLMANIPEAFSNDSRPKQLEWMIRQAKSIAGK